VAPTQARGKVEILTTWGHANFEGAGGGAMKKQQDKEKTFFQLWVEYLKRSADYKEFCEWVAKRRKNPELLAPVKFYKIEGSKEVFNYSVFGPVHDPRWTFDEWWYNHQKKLSHRRTHSSPKPIEDYIEIIGRDMRWYIDSFQRQKGKEPTLKEFIDNFPSYLKGEPFIYLMVNIGGIEIQALKDQFGSMIKQKIKEPYFKYWDWSCKRWYQPVMGKKMIDELERYLKVYDRRKKRTPWRQIIEEFSCDFTENKRRAFLQDKKNAEKIIENVEYGFFPGRFRKG
jgi:hypothetical protein